jgi:hypothetical protein
VVLESVVELVELAAHVAEVVEQRLPLFGKWCSSVVSVNLERDTMDFI